MDTRRQASIGRKPLHRGLLVVVAGLISASGLSQCQAGVLFSAPYLIYDTGRRPFQVVFGDLDGDGRQDLVTANSDSTFSVLLGNGDGTVSTKTDYEAAFGTSQWMGRTGSLALGDLNGDGRADVITGSSSSGGVSVFLGSTDGRLQTSPAFASGHSVVNLVTADMNGDGNLDVVTVNRDSTVLVLSGNGDGTLRATAMVNTPMYPDYLVVEDLNGDGNRDLAVARLGGISVFFGQGDGTFGSRTDYAVAGDFISSLAVSDLNQDGHRDLIISANGISVLLGNGDGTFSAGTNAPIYTQSVCVADLNSDGLMDLVAATGSDVSVYAGRGDGSFRPAASFASGVDTGHGGNLAIGDLNGDLRPDVAVVTYFDFAGSVSVLLGNDDGTLGGGVSLPDVREARSLAVEDLNHDHLSDLVTLTASGRISVFLQNADGSLHAGTEVDSVDGTALLVTADVNHDAAVDIVTLGAPVSASVISVFLGNGDGTFRPRIDHELNHDSALLAVGDFTGDGILDIAAAAGLGGNVVSVLRGNGDGTFISMNDIESGQSIRCLAAADVNGDDRLDIVAANDSTITELLGHGDGSFSDPTLFAGGLYPFSMAIDDVNRDGNEDIVTANYGDGTVLTLLGDGHGGFIFGSSCVSGAYFPSSLTVTDLDGDGRVDLALGDTSGKAVSVLPGNGDGTFGARMDFGVGESGHLAVGDLNGDGRPDIACAGGYWGGSITLLYNLHETLMASVAVVPQPPVPLGRPVLIRVTPMTGVSVSNASLFYRQADQTAFVEIPFQPARSGFEAVIPGEALGEAGVEFYSIIRRDNLVASLPRSGAAVPSYIETEYVRVVPQATQAGYLPGSDVKMMVVLPSRWTFMEGMLHYRRGGEKNYIDLPLRPGRPLHVPEATIPGADVGDTGIDYWVDVRAQRDTLRSWLSSPPAWPNAPPNVIRTRVGNIEETDPAPGRRYRLVSFPADSTGGDLAALLSVRPEFGRYDRARWRAFRYSPGSGTTVEYSLNDSRNFRAEPGRAYWLICSSENRVGLGAAGGLSTSTAGPYPIVLAPGWNQVGDPFAFPVSRSNLIFPADAESLIAFDPQLGKLGDYAEGPVSAMEPFKGYFIYNAAAQPETLRVKPVAASPADIVSTPAVTSVRIRTAGSPQDWAVRLEAVTAQANDTGNIIGVDAIARDQRDVLDERKPPPSPGDWVQLAFAHSDWRERPGLYRRDIRTAGAEGHAWDIELRTGAKAKDVTLQPSAVGELPEDLVIRLIDREEGTSVMLREPGGPMERYALLSHGPDEPYHLLLLAGTREYVEREAGRLTEIPATAVLEQNSPNPFRSATRIRFGVAHEERVWLDIYNVSGERLVRLLDGVRLPAGYHSEIWNGTDEKGRSIASGIYFYRLTIGTQTMTKRLVLVK